MSPHTLSNEPPAADEPPTATGPGPTATPRSRLTVREMQIALAAARGLAGAALTRTVTDRGEKVGAARTHTAPDHGAVEEHSSVTAPMVAPTRPATPPADAPAANPTNPEPWLPEHDGPVSLTGVAAPRRRAAAARPDKAARRPAPKPRPRRRAKAATIGPELAAAVAADPPRIVVVPACGGAGATTAAVLLAAGLAPACGAILLAAGPDRGSLALRCNAQGGDLDTLAGWVRHHPRRPLQIDTRGVAIGTSGQDEFVVAAGSRRPGQDVLAADTAIALLSAASATRAAVVLDWCTREPVPGRVRDTAQHAVVVAPTSCAGLLDAEYTVDQLEATRPEHTTTLSLLTIDVRGRAPRRAGRAALARLRTLRIPTTGLPYDPALADDPRIHWPSLRPRTRAAIFTALTQMLHREDEK
jgi:hypothetical protein